jgi:hypothetical protein
MIDKEILRGEAAHYRTLAEQLQERFVDIDDDTLHDTLQGMSNLPDMIEEIVRSCLDDEAMIGAMKIRLEALSGRQARFKSRVERKRELVSWAMGQAAMGRLDVADFSVFLRQGLQKLAIDDEAQLPDIYLVPQPPKVNRNLLLDALKSGSVIAGASLVLGEPHIMVRTS